MNIISYPIEYLGMTNTVSALEAQNSPCEKTQFYIAGRLVDHEHVSDVLKQLVYSGYLEAGNKEENDRRSAVLNLLSNYSIATVAIEHAKRGYPYLHHDDISIEFKSDNHCGLEMHYSVSYNDGFQPLFTLGCQLLLGKNFELDEEKSRVFFEFKDQCPSDLKNDLDCRTIKDMILDWLKNLFSMGHNSIPFAIKRIPDAVEIPQRPFTELTDAELRHEVLKSDDEFVHTEDYWEDEFTTLEDVDETTSYNAGVAAGYKEGVEVGFIVGEANGYINSLATQQNDI